MRAKHGLTLLAAAAFALSGCTIVIPTETTPGVEEPEKRITSNGYRFEDAARVDAVCTQVFQLIYSQESLNSASSFLDWSSNYSAAARAVSKEPLLSEFGPMFQQTADFWSMVETNSQGTPEQMAAMEEMVKLQTDVGTDFLDLCTYITE